MKRIYQSVVAVCFLSSLTALAATQTITFEDMKAACQNPARFHNQIAPSNIQISCKDVQLKWVPDTGTGQSLDNSRQITTSLISDKYTTDSFTAAIQMDAQTVVCPSYKQISETVNTVRSVSCDDMIAFKGGATEFCTATVNSLRAANPEAVNVQATGLTLNLCNADTQQQGGKQGGQVAGGQQGDGTFHQ